LSQSEIANIVSESSTIFRRFDTFKHHVGVRSPGLQIMLQEWVIEQRHVLQKINNESPKKTELKTQNHPKKEKSKTRHTFETENKDF
jgi:hypothetical protein